MKKIILLSSLLMFCQAGASCFGGNVVSQVCCMSNEAMSFLQHSEVNEESIANFKKVVQSGIDRLNGNKNNDSDGTIGLQIAVQSDLLLLADKLLEFYQKPDQRKAQELRGIAMSCYNMREIELIQSVMDKMKDPYKFSPPAGNADGVSGNDSSGKNDQFSQKDEERFDNPENEEESD